MKKLTLIILTLLFVMSGCILQPTKHISEEYLLPPPDSLTVYVHGEKQILQKDSENYNILWDEFDKAIKGITDGVGGQRSWARIGFERSKALNQYILVVAEWKKRQTVSLNQKEMPLGEQGWESTPRGAEGNYQISTDGFLIQVYSENLDTKICYKVWSEEKKQPIYWGNATSNNIDPKSIMGIISNIKLTR